MNCWDYGGANRRVQRGTFRPPLTRGSADAGAASSSHMAGLAAGSVFYIPPVRGLREGVNDDRPEPTADEPRFVERAASAEVNGRRVNEAIERGTEAAGTAVFVCECGNLGCTATVELTISSYEMVRSSFDRFLVIPGHEIESVEEVVERHDCYLVVVKRDGRAVAMAALSDDRNEG